MVGVSIMSADWDYKEGLLPLTLSAEASAARLPYWPKDMSSKAMAADCTDILATVRDCLRSGRLPAPEFGLFEKDSSISCVFLCNKLEGVLPPMAVVHEAEVFRILEQSHDKAAHAGAYLADVVPRGRWNANGGTSKEEARWQLQAATVALMWIRAQAQAQGAGGGLTLEVLLDCYARLMNGAIGERNRALPVEFRHCSVFSASGFIYPSHDHVRHHMQSVCDGYNWAAEKRLPFLQIAARLHYSSVLVHPFEDGNGRFCRLLVNYAMTVAGFPYAVPLTNGRPQVDKDYMECLLSGDRLPAHANTGLLECFFLEATHRSLCNLRRNLLEKTFTAKGVSPAGPPGGQSADSSPLLFGSPGDQSEAPLRQASSRREFVARCASTREDHDGSPPPA